LPQKAKEGFFGSSTPSSKVPVKPNSSTKHQRNRGGGKPGHKGHGRSSICEQDADDVERVAIDNVCPGISNCQNNLCITVDLRL
jgi:transposase